ncbi:probable RNA-binding protein EIF1AD [Planococcus citri]|uniref:probable RNA-binding protein EIF1AD n=1 Tax=Planococcus citri TaxID=170843 RepID=UPI0031F88FA7
MSSCLKKKHVMNEILSGDVEIKDGHQLVKVLKTQGNHLYEVQTTDNRQFLVSMPSKFRNTIWIKPGSFVIIEFIAEGNKVKGEIVKILLKEHVKEMKKDSRWQQEFDIFEQSISNEDNQIKSTSSSEEESS